MSQRNGTSFSLHVANIKHEKCIFLIGCISSSLDYFSITSLFQHVKLCVTIFLSMKSAMRNFTANFGRTKFDTHTVLSLDEVLISLIIQYFFKCCFLLDAVQEKYSYVSYATLHFICRIVESIEITWNAHNLADLRAQGVRIRNSLICYII